MTHSRCEGSDVRISPAQPGSPTQEKYGTGSKPDTELALTSCRATARSTSLHLQQVQVTKRRKYSRSATGQKKHNYNL